ncbi:unannotated protein [freshwater metagenome]|uniref:Unannotated protein n=1 Tax=freshwater metagenome TaxID=449393 RepID=A0A6J6J0Y5_9ZZZZ|nr:hypothetical protein [Actinomycetota bacterium]MSY08020.1 hypothetical protein [Actinomycetota bacterium]MSZ37000.1 hypothetical protein [Actinomycetota bacterium]MTA00030.1 hypothetical protein [Actinomycetota bacterium]MTA10780.1 hypothetical protein [Actinomycetota bacterium]
MIKRLIWFVSGVVAGISGVLFAGKRVKRSVTSFTPIKVAQRATQTTRSRLNSVGDAFREGRDAMRDKEFEMKAKRDGRVESFDQQGPIRPLQQGDELLVDGQRIEPGRVIVLREEMRQGRTRRQKHSRQRP